MTNEEVLLLVLDQVEEVLTDVLDLMDAQDRSSGAEKVSDIEDRAFEDGRLDAILEVLTLLTCFNADPKKNAEFRARVRRLIARCAHSDDVRAKVGEFANTLYAEDRKKFAEVFHHGDQTGSPGVGGLLDAELREIYEDHLLED
jgi:hypothetical protein